MQGILFVRCLLGAYVEPFFYNTYVEAWCAGKASGMYLLSGATTNANVVETERFVLCFPA